MSDLGVGCGEHHEEERENDTLVHQHYLQQDMD